MFASLDIGEDMAPNKSSPLTRRLTKLLIAGYESAIRDFVAAEISKQFLSHGLSLGHDQSIKAASELLSRKMDRLNLELNDEQTAALRAHNDGELPQITVDLQSVGEKADRLEIALPSIITKVMAETTNNLASVLVEKWKANVKEVVGSLRQEQSEFTEILTGRWGAALDRLDALIDLVSEIGGEQHQEALQKRAIDNDANLEAAFLLHIRACQVAREVLALLRAGLPDGAIARWRTLHELAVTASFIQKHGAHIARRFLDHADAQTYRAAKQYQEHCVKLGRPPLTPDEMRPLEVRQDELIRSYDSAFMKDNGWAIPVIRPEKAKSSWRPTFANIESDVEMEFVRPFVQTANDSVHAGARGTAFRLSAALSGSSDVGLELPGRNAAWSLIHITATLLAHVPSVENLIMSSGLYEFGKDIYAAFDGAAYQFDEPDVAPPA